MSKYLIIGAGFTGSTIARLLADNNHQIDIIESRSHIGGNAHDEYNDDGILIHPYGPHIFHTNSSKIFQFLSRFTDWRNYEHVVKTSVSNKILNFPINRNTINTLYDLELASQADLEHFFDKRKVHHKKVTNSRQHVEAQIGTELCEMFFSNYTRKHWGLDLSELASSVAARIPYRVNDDPRYFEDLYQQMPLDGYHKLFQSMLCHPQISVTLNTKWSKNAYDWEAYSHIFYTGEIDRYYDYELGKLGYRSVQFIHETHQKEHYQSAATINYPNEHPYTRITEFKKITGQIAPSTSIVKEVPQAEGEPYYPIPTDQNRVLYRKYLKRAENEKNISFCGRLGAYKYLNMDQAVGAGMMQAEKELLKYR